MILEIGLKSSWEFLSLRIQNKGQIELDILVLIAVLGTMKWGAGEDPNTPIHPDYLAPSIYVSS